MVESKNASFGVNGGAPSMTAFCRATISKKSQNPCKHPAGDRNALAGHGQTGNHQPESPGTNSQTRKQLQATGWVRRHVHLPQQEDRHTQWGE